MTTRTILALAVAAGFLSATAAIAQTAPATPAPATPAPTAPATTAAKPMTHAATSGHHMAMRHMPMHTTKAAAHGRAMHAAPSRDAGNSAVDALNAQSLARARGTQAQ